MIEITGRSVIVPEAERLLGFTEDNECETRTIHVRNKELSGYNFKIDIMDPGGTRNIFEPVKTEALGEIYLEWRVKKEHIAKSGVLLAQVRAFSAGDIVWHSDIFEFEIRQSIEAVKQYSDIPPSEFEEIEKTISINSEAAQEAKNKAVSAAEAAETAETEAKSAQSKASESAQEAANSAAEAKEAEKTAKETLNEYAKKEDIPSYSAGKHIEIDSSGKISAAGVQSYSDMTGFSGSVLLTPQDMLDMVPLALSSGSVSFTDESRAAARANLKAAKDSVVSDSLTLDSSGYVTAIGGYALYKDIEGVEL